MYTNNIFNYKKLIPLNYNNLWQLFNVGMKTKKVKPKEIIVGL